MFFAFGTPAASAVAGTRRRSLPLIVGLVKTAALEYYTAALTKQAVYFALAIWAFFYGLILHRLK